MDIQMYISYSAQPNPEPSKRFHKGNKRSPWRSVLDPQKRVDGVHLRLLCNGTLHSE